MAAISSNGTGGGLWSATSTWAGGVVPVAGDTVTIDAGDTVTFDVADSPQLGAVTLNGLLSWAVNMSAKLNLGHVDITINNGGELRMGTQGTPLPKQYTAEIVWATTADSAKGLYINTGGKLTGYGDPAYYGSSYSTTLADNWTATYPAPDGKTFTVVGDYTTKWNAGDALTVHKYALYSNYNNDVTLVTIASMALNGANTDITINEAFPGGTFNAGGHVNNLVRNVKLSLSGAATAVGSYNSNRPRIYDLNAEGNNNCVLSNVQVTGFADINSNYGFRFLDSVLRNGKGFSTSNSAARGHTLSGLIFSCGGGTGLFYYGRGHNISAEVYSCSGTAFYYIKNYDISGDIYACNTGLNAGVDSTITGNIYSNSTGQQGGANTFKDNAVFFNTSGFSNPTGCRMINCAVSYKPDRTTLAANSNDFYFNGGLMVSWTAYGGKWQTNPTLNGGGTRGTIGHTYYGAFQDYNGVAGDHRVYMDYMTLTRETTVTRPGGASDSIKAEPYSAEASIYNAPKILEWTEPDVPASAQTRSVFMRGYGWTGFPANTELYFEAEYISDATTRARTIAKSTAVLTDNTTWVEFPVTFTPAARGAVRYRAWLEKYQSNSGVHIDNKLNGGPSSAKWVDGWSTLGGTMGGMPIGSSIIKGD